jgi:hypothetical protein
MRWAGRTHLNALLYAVDGAACSGRSAASSTVIEKYQPLITQNHPLPIALLFLFCERYDQYFASAPPFV